MSIEYLNLVFSRLEPRGANLRVVLITLADMANGEGVCWPSVRYLSERAGISERSVQRALRVLEKQSFVSISLGGLGSQFLPKRASVYTVLKSDDNLTPSRVTDSTLEGDKSVGARVTELARDGDSLTPQPPENQNTENHHTNQARKARGKVGFLPSEQPEPISTRMLVVNQLRNRLASTRWSAKEFAAFRAAGLADMDEVDFERQLTPMLRYYTAPLGWLREFWRVDGAQDFRRRELLTLLHNWGGELDRATAYADWLGQKNERDARSRLTSGIVTNIEMDRMMADRMRVEGET